MKTTKHLLLVLSTISLMVSCKEEKIKVPDAVPEKPFPHIKTGNRWVYDFIYKGKVQDSLVREILSNDAGGIYTAFLADKILTIQEYYFVEGGNLMYFAEGQTKNEAVIQMKSNVKSGDSWYKITDGDTIEVTVAKSNEIKETPAGTYTCVHLQEKYLGTSQVIDYLIDPKNGMIYMKMIYAGNIAEYVLRRKNF